MCFSGCKRSPCKTPQATKTKFRWTGLELLLLLCGGQLLSLTMHLMLLQWSTKEGKWWKIQKTRSGHWGRRNRCGKHCSGEQVLLLRQTDGKTPGVSHGTLTALPLLCTSASISTPWSLSQIREKWMLLHHRATARVNSWMIETARSLDCKGGRDWTWILIKIPLVDEGSGQYNSKYQNREDTTPKGIMFKTSQQQRGFKKKKKFRNCPCCGDCRTQSTLKWHIIGKIGGIGIAGPTQNGTELRNTGFSESCCQQTALKYSHRTEAWSLLH